MYSIRSQMGDALQFIEGLTVSLPILSAPIVIKGISEIPWPLPDESIEQVYPSLIYAREIKDGLSARVVRDEDQIRSPYPPGCLMAPRCALHRYIETPVSQAALNIL
jgi:hypothetical protein